MPGARLASDSLRQPCEPAADERVRTAGRGSVWPGAEAEWLERDVLQAERSGLWASCLGGSLAHPSLPCYSQDSAGRGPGWGQLRQRCVRVQRGDPQRVLSGPGADGDGKAVEYAQGSLEAQLLKSYLKKIKRLSDFLPSSNLEVSHQLIPNILKLVFLGLLYISCQTVCFFHI